MIPTPPLDYIERFAASLPQSYRAKYDHRAIITHAKVAWNRKDNPVQVGLLSSATGKPEGLCVAAKDQPGLLSTISGALILVGLDVVDAEAYTRKLEDGSYEAVDLFWVRKVGAPTSLLSDEDAAAFNTTLTEIVLGRRRVPSIPPLSQTEAPPLYPSDTRVRFIEDNSGVFSTLEVETGDRSGLLLSLSRALFEHKVQIMRSEVTTRNGRVFDRFMLVEFDGAPISEARRLEIQVAVLGAVEPARRKTPISAAQA